MGELKRQHYMAAHAAVVTVELWAYSRFTVEISEGFSACEEISTAPLQKVLGTMLQMHNIFSKTHLTFNFTDAQS